MFQFVFLIFFLLFSSGTPAEKTSFTRYKMFGMSSHIWCALFVMVVLTGFGEPASILMIPCSHYSYINTFSVFGKTLISAGHEVGWVGNFYRPQTMLPEGNVFTPVCQSFCSQGRGVSQHARGRGAVHPLRTPWTDTPRQTPPRQTPPRRPLKRAVRILLECI